MSAAADQLVDLERRLTAGPTEQQLDEIEHQLVQLTDAPSPSGLQARLLLARLSLERRDSQTAYRRASTLLDDVNGGEHDPLTIQVAALFAQIGGDESHRQDVIAKFQALTSSDLVPYHIALGLSDVFDQHGDRSSSTEVLVRSLASGGDSLVGRTSVLQRLGMAYETAGRTEAASECFQEALRISEPLAPWIRGTLANSTSVSLLLLGRLDEAAGAADLALQLATQSGDRELEANALLSRGNVCTASGQDELALRLFHSAMVAGAHAGSRVHEVTLLVNIATAYLALGQPMLYVRYLMWALDSTEELHDLPARALALQQLAVLSPEADAQALFSEAYAIQLELGNVAGQAGCLIGLARLSRTRGYPEDAVKFATEALGIAESASNPELSIDIHEWLAEAFIELDDATTAWCHLEEAWRWSERQRRETAAGGVRNYLDRHSVAALLDGVALARDQAQQSTGAERTRWVSRAIAMAERTRARGLVDQLSSRAATDLLLPEEAQLALRLAAQRIRQLRDDLESQAESHERADALRHELGAARTQFDELHRFLGQQHSRFGAMESVEPVDLKSVQAGLDDRVAVLHFVRYRDQLASVVVRRDTVELFDLGPREGVERLRIRLEELCSSVIREAEAIELCGELGEIILAPILAAGALDGASEIAVVPEATTSALPIEVLLVNDEHLSANRSVTYLPALTAARFLRQPRRIHQGLVLADPDGTLPYARTEAQAVAQLLPTVISGGPLLGARATKAALLDLAPTADLIHVASHARYSRDAPELSSIAFAGGDRNPALNLEAGDIVAGRISAELVVLSGCDTGQASHDTTNEMIGLVRTFLCMGASSVIATRWPVRDASTSELMRTFYRAIGEGLPPSAALDRARHDHVTLNGYTHPGHWGPYMYFGLPRHWPASRVTAT